MMRFTMSWRSCSHAMGIHCHDGDDVTVHVVDKEAIEAACGKGKTVEVVGMPGQQSLCD